MMAIINVLNRSLMITGFVFVMMLMIEYINVQTSGEWQKKLVRYKWGQYILAAFLGAIPGCLGAFVVVAMFSHRLISLGAVVAAMIATSGDESFVLLAMIPKDALILTLLLFVIGISSGAVTDFLVTKRVSLKKECEGLEVHDIENCICFSKREILQQWKQRYPFRTILTMFLLLFLVLIVTGQIGPSQWNWMRISILLVSAISLFIVITVPDHFLEEHLWKHLVQQHVPRIFFWTFGTLLVMHVIIDQLHFEDVIRDNLWAVLTGASLIGLIPESGPHLMFVTLYADGIIPFSVLLASSIIQDGHGMLPMLAHSKRAFIIIKLINLLIGFSVGSIILAFN
jgi:hypothetical protein